MGDLVQGRGYPLPSPYRLVALRNMSEADADHPVERSLFDWLRAVARVQHEVGGEGRIRYFGDQVRAGEVAIDLELWEELLLLPFLHSTRWEDGSPFADRAVLLKFFAQVRFNLRFVDAALLRTQDQLLLAPIAGAADTSGAVRVLGRWPQDHGSFRSPVFE